MLRDVSVPLEEPNACVISTVKIEVVVKGVNAFALRKEDRLKKRDSHKSTSVCDMVRSISMACRFCSF